MSTRRLSAFRWATGLRPPSVRTGGFFVSRGFMHTVFLIDGFNFYHSIKFLAPQFHWVNYALFCKNFLRRNDVLDRILYFTAIAFWIKNAEKRHIALIEANKLQKVEVIFGKFKEKHSKCPHCNNKIIRHEEKATDVNIALYAYRIAQKGIEQIFFVTGDTDMLPSIRLIKEDFPNVKVGVVFPYQRHSKELANEADLHHKTTIDLLERCILPLEITKPNGKKIFCPAEWRSAT